MLCQDVEAVPEPERVIRAEGQGPPERERQRGARGLHERPFEPEADAYVPFSVNADAVLGDSAAGARRAEGRVETPVMIGQGDLPFGTGSWTRPPNSGRFGAVGALSHPLGSSFP